MRRLDRAEELSPSAEKVVAELIANGVRGRAVTFDADGTLWSGDVGEEMLRELDEAGVLAKPGAFAEYERRVDEPSEAFAFGVEVMHGLSCEALEDRCAALFARTRTRVFPFVRDLLARLRQAGTDVWIVSASPVWAVVPGAAELGVSRERIIAVECAVEGGKLVAPAWRPVPCGEGKVACLRARGVRPVLAAGNSLLDGPMLDYAERGLLVAPDGADSAVVQRATERRWAVQWV